MLHRSQSNDQAHDEVHECRRTGCQARAFRRRKEGEKEGEKGQESEEKEEQKIKEIEKLDLLIL